MKEITFNDFKKKKKFTTSNYELIQKGNRTYAETIAPSGIKVKKLVGMI